MIVSPHKYFPNNTSVNNTILGFEYVIFAGTVLPQLYHFRLPIMQTYLLV